MSTAFGDCFRTDIDSASEAVLPRMKDSVMQLKSPYQDLYVYLINGIVGFRDEAVFGNEFLGTWVEGETSFLFFPIPSREKVDSLIMDRPEISLLEEHYFSYEEWQGTRLEPIRVGKFLIIPPWSNEEPEEGEAKIILDPGVVFGTGIHPTTRDCLSAMVWLYEKEPFRTVLDLGTGTGILAVAAGRLGARKVWAVDLNPLCVKTSAGNVRLNQMVSVVDVLEGKAEDFAEKAADLVLANIHHDVLKNLAELENFRRKPWLILSGLMRSQARDIKEKLISSGLKIVKEWDGEGIWTTMLVRGVSNE